MVQSANGTGGIAVIIPAVGCKFVREKNPTRPNFFVPLAFLCVLWYSLNHCTNYTYTLGPLTESLKGMSPAVTRSLLGFLHEAIAR